MEKGKKIISNEYFFEGIAFWLSYGASVKIHTKGKSMAPFIFEGKDCIVLKKIKEDSFQQGNLLLVQLRNGRYVLHRVVKYEEGQIKLRGDGNLSTVETCTGDEVIGEVVTVIRSGKSIKKGSQLWNMHRNIWLGSILQRRIMLAIYHRFPFLLNIFFLGLYNYET